MSIRKSFILIFFILYLLHVNANIAIDHEIYYTHNNHLGSAAWITERHGGPVQYLHYLPYGQLLANQMLYGYDERFKFIGKERDWESGYDYFGARYYISPFMHFASVEPLLDNYLHISPYSYAAWNPIKYYDFNGMDVTLAGLNKSSISVKTNIINLNVDIAKLNIDFGGRYNFHGDEILGSTLDIVGIFDPSGIADGLNAALQLNNGDISGAAISIMGLLPYVGDVAKVGKVKKDLGVINNAIEAAGKGIGNKFTNARKMTPKENNQYFGDKEWHDKNYNKKSMINKFRKELKGSTNADMYIDRDTKQIYLKGNKSNAWADTGEVLQ